MTGNEVSSYILPTCVRLPIQDDILKEVVNKAKDWALMHGAAMRPKTDFNPDIVQFAPFVLFPSTIKTADFNKIINIQIMFNELIHKVAHNREFIRKCLSDTILVDQFTRNMYNIFETVENEGVAQPLSLGLIRCDWMQRTNEEFDSSNCGWKQVEINTIAAGFGWLGPISKGIHQYVLEELDHHEKINNLPENKALSGLCEGLLSAWKLYGNPKAVILFVVEDITFNICDQRFHEYEIQRLNSTAKMVRKTLTEIGKTAFLAQENKLILGFIEIAVIYFRAGYHPDHYPSETEWNARLLMEKSKAIKCPTIQYHLAGTKKVQQELAKPNALELFLEKNKAERVRDFFVGLYGLEFDDLGELAVEMALAEPDRFVLKPQREGGGNNIYGNDISKALLSMKDNRERTAWIIMERIRPPISKGYMVRPGEPIPPKLINMVSELGIFGVVIGDKKNVIVNRQVGHMLRTKVSTANEGGVATGFGALDSPYLTD